MSDINRPECRSRVNQRVITNSDVQLGARRTNWVSAPPPSVYSGLMGDVSLAQIIDRAASGWRKRNPIVRKRVSSRTLNWSFRRQRPTPDQKILQYFFTQYFFTQYFFTQYFFT